MRTIHTSKGEVPLLPAAPPREPEPDVALVLRPLPDAVPMDVRLRQLLKVALRRFRFRCLGCTDVAPPAHCSAQDAPGSHADDRGGP